MVTRSTPEPEVLSAQDYTYSSEAAAHTQFYFWTTVEHELLEHTERGSQVLDLGCSNSSFSAQLASLGDDVTAIDSLREGITLVRVTHPGLALKEGFAYDPLATHYGAFDAFVTLEVVKHVYAPQLYDATLFFRPRGRAELPSFRVPISARPSIRSML